METANNQTLTEKYFTARFNDDGYLEAVCLHRTLKDAKDFKKYLQKKFSTNKIIIGKRLE